MMFPLVLHHQGTSRNIAMLAPFIVWLLGIRMTPGDIGRGPCRHFTLNAFQGFVSHGWEGEEFPTTILAQPELIILGSTSS